MNYLPTITSIAKTLLASGLSVVPILPDKSKRPRCPIAASGKPEWKQWQSAPMRADEVNRLFHLGDGIGIIGGKVSGNLEDMDFDEPGLYEEFEAVCRDNGIGDERGDTWILDLVLSLPLARTPSGGNHLYYRCTEPIKADHQLAVKPGVDKHGKPISITRIETRGEGSYAVVPPSPATCHQDNKPYEMLRGDLGDIPVLTPEQVALLHAMARLFTDMSVQEEQERFTPAYSSPNPDGPLRPGDDYNQRGDVLQLLEAHGWKARRSGGQSVLIRPGKTHGSSATFNGEYLFCFSSNGDPFEAEKAYSRFAVYALLEHGGDFREATRRLGEQGFGEPLKKESKTAEKPPVLISNLPASAGRSDGESGEEDSDLPVIIPPRKPKILATGSALCKRHYQLIKWAKDATAAVQSEKSFLIGEAYATANVSEKVKSKVMAEVCQGHNLAISTVQNAASVYNAFPTVESRMGMPFAICAELMAKTQDVRETTAQQYRESKGKLSREQVRANLGHMPAAKRQAKGAHALAGRNIPQSLFERLNSQLVNGVVTDRRFAHDLKMMMDYYDKNPGSDLDEETDRETEQDGAETVSPLQTIKDRNYKSEAEEIKEDGESVEDSAPDPYVAEIDDISCNQQMVTNTLSTSENEGAEDAPFDEPDMHLDVESPAVVVSQSPGPSAVQSTSPPSGEGVEADLPRRAAAAWRKSELTPDPELLSQILGRTVTDPATVFSDASAPEAARLLHYAQKGQTLKPGVVPEWFQSSYTVSTVA